MREQGVRLVWGWALKEGVEWYRVLSGAEEMMQGGVERQE